MPLGPRAVDDPQPRAIELAAQHLHPDARVSAERVEVSARSSNRTVGGGSMPDRMAASTIRWYTAWIAARLVVGRSAR